METGRQMEVRRLYDGMPVTDVGISFAEVFSGTFGRSTGVGVRGCGDY